MTFNRFQYINKSYFTTIRYKTTYLQMKQIGGHYHASSQGPKQCSQGLSEAWCTVSNQTTKQTTNLQTVMYYFVWSDAYVEPRRTKLLKLSSLVTNKVLMILSVKALNVRHCSCRLSDINKPRCVLFLVILCRAIKYQALEVFPTYSKSCFVDMSCWTVLPKKIVTANKCRIGRGIFKWNDPNIYSIPTDNWIKQCFGG